VILRQQGKVLRRVLLILAILLILIIAVPLFFRISIDMSGYKRFIESSIARELGRRAVVDGTIKVTTSLWPYFEIQGLRIGNPDDFGEGDLASMDLARISIGLLPLLQDKVHVRKLAVEGLTLNLDRNAAGDVNWQFNRLSKPGGNVSAHAQQDLSTALAVDKLEFKNISIHFRDELGGEDMNFTMDSATGSAAFGRPMGLVMDGTVLGHPFTLDVEASSLGDFLAMTNSRLDFEFDIAQTRFQFSGTSDTLGSGKVIDLQVSVEGETLDSLDSLLRIDLPPIADYRLNARMKASPDRLELSDLEARVKNSELTGSIVVDGSGAKPLISAELTSELIQLDDFDTGDWSPDQTTPSEEPIQSDASPEEEKAAVLSPETLQRANVQWIVNFKEVLSGEDRLGSGRLQAGLTDGRIDIHPLKLELPDSDLLMEATFKPGDSATQSALRLLIENFDFGVLMRLSDPDSDVGGAINLDLDIKTNAGNFRAPLAGASGYFDLAVSPENLGSEAVDLWAVNLLSSVVDSSVKGEKQQVNCVLSRWSLENGVMTARNLAVDTSRIRICGTGEIDFNQQNFNLRASPKAKKPEFFSLATPLSVKGDFSDFAVGADLGLLSVGTTAIKFAVSPVTTPVARLVREDLPADGSDICQLPIGPHEGELEELPGC